jgi:putative nucleotidyltransferase with HDIG domain
VREAVTFLHSFAQSISALSLYPEGHVSRERALDNVYQAMFDLLGKDRSPRFSFLGDEVVYNDVPLREFQDWDWSARMAGVGVQRMEINQSVTRDDLEGVLEDIMARLHQSPINTAEARQMAQTGIRWGAIGLEGDTPKSGELPEATIAFTLGEEAEAIRWMHTEVTSGRDIPMGEAEAVVRGLAVAMHGDQQLVLPLLKLRKFDEYTTTHSMNVSVLTMALAEWMGLGARDVRAFGIAGLMHDIGKVTIPYDVLNKSGKLNEKERALMNAHPVEGARLILKTEDDLDLAAVVAYEHHIMLNGGGYPSMRYTRDCHDASKLVHVCDVYDALRTNRPYRDAWPPDKVLAYLEERSGTEFDGQIAQSFTNMMQAWEPTLAYVGEADPVPGG